MFEELYKNQEIKKALEEIGEILNGSLVDGSQKFGLLFDEDGNEKDLANDSDQDGHNALLKRYWAKDAIERLLKGFSKENDKENDTERPDFQDKVVSIESNLKAADRLLGEWMKNDFGISDQNTAMEQLAASIKIARLKFENIKGIINKALADSERNRPEESENDADNKEKDSDSVKNLIQTFADEHGTVLYDKTEGMTPEQLIRDVSEKTTEQLVDQFEKRKQENKTALTTCENRISNENKYIEEVTGKINAYQKILENIEVIGKDTEAYNQLKIETEKLTSEYTDINADVERHQQEFDDLADRLMKLNTASGDEEKLSNDKKQLEEELQQLQKLEDGFNKQIKNLEKQQKEKEEEREPVSKGIDDCNEAIRGMEGAIAKANQAIEELSSDYLKLKSEIEIQKKEISRREEQRKKAEEDRKKRDTELRKSLEKYFGPGLAWCSETFIGEKEKNKEYIEKQQKLSIDLANATAMIASSKVSTDLMRLQDEIWSLTSKIGTEKVDKNRKDLFNEKEKKTKEREKLIKNDTAAQEYVKAYDAFQGNKLICDSSQNNLNTYRERIADPTKWEDINRDADQIVKDLSENQENFKKEDVALTKQLDELKSKLAELEEKRSEIQRKVTDSMASELSISDYEEMISKNVEQLTEQQKKLAGYKEKESQLTTEIKNLAVGINGNKKKIEEKKQQKKDKKEEIEALENLEAERKKTEEECRKKDSELKKKEAERERSGKKVAEKEKQLIEKEQELKDKKEQLLGAAASLDSTLENVSFDRLKDAVKKKQEQAESDQEIARSNLSTEKEKQKKYQKWSENLTKAGKDLIKLAEKEEEIKSREIEDEANRRLSSTTRKTKSELITETKRQITNYCDAIINAKKYGLSGDNTEYRNLKTAAETMRLALQQDDKNEYLHSDRAQTDLKNLKNLCSKYIAAKDRDKPILFSTDRRKFRINAASTMKLYINGLLTTDRSVFEVADIEEAEKEAQKILSNKEEDLKALKKATEEKKAKVSGHKIIEEPEEEEIFKNPAPKSDVPYDPESDLPFKKERPGLELWELKKLEGYLKNKNSVLNGLSGNPPKYKGSSLSLGKEDQDLLTTLLEKHGELHERILNARKHLNDYIAYQNEAAWKSYMAEMSGIHAVFGGLKEDPKNPVIRGALSEFRHMGEAYRMGTWYIRMADNHTKYQSMQTSYKKYKSLQEKQEREKKGLLYDEKTENDFIDQLSILGNEFEKKSKALFSDHQLNNGFFYEDTARNLAANLRDSLVKEKHGKHCEELIRALNAGLKQIDSDSGLFENAIKDIKNAVRKYQETDRWPVNNAYKEALCSGFLIDLEDAQNLRKVQEDLKAQFTIEGLENAMTREKPVTGVDKISFDSEEFRQGPGKSEKTKVNEETKKVGKTEGKFVKAVDGKTVLTMSYDEKEKHEADMHYDINQKPVVSEEDKNPLKEGRRVSAGEWLQNQLEDKTKLYNQLRNGSNKINLTENKVTDKNYLKTGSLENVKELETIHNDLSDNIAVLDTEKLNDYHKKVQEHITDNDPVIAGAAWTLAGDIRAAIKKMNGSYEDTDGYFRNDFPSDVEELANQLSIVKHGGECGALINKLRAYKKDLEKHIENQGFQQQSRIKDQKKYNETVLKIKEDVKEYVSKKTKLEDTVKKAICNNFLNDVKQYGWPVMEKTAAPKK